MLIAHILMFNAILWVHFIIFHGSVSIVNVTTCQLLLQAIKSWKCGTVFCAYQVMGIVEINQFLLFLFLCIWFYTSSPYGLSSVGSGKVKILSFFKTIFLRILLHYPVSSVHRMLKDYLYTDWYLYSLLVRFLHDV